MRSDGYAVMIAEQIIIMLNLSTIEEICMLGPKLNNDFIKKRFDEFCKCFSFLERKQVMRQLNEEYARVGRYVTSEEMNLFLTDVRHIITEYYRSILEQYLYQE